MNNSNTFLEYLFGGKDTPEPLAEVQTSEGVALTPQFIYSYTTVKYTFNRFLTWSEREALREWLLDNVFDYEEHVVSKKYPNVVTIVVLGMDSRHLTDYVSLFAETLLNVHPVSAHTLDPKVRV